MILLRAERRFPIHFLLRDTDLATPPFLPVASKVAVALLGPDEARFVTMILCRSMYSGTVLTVFSALAVGTVLVMRRKEPDLPSPYRTPFYPPVPRFFILMSMVIVWNALHERPFEGVMGIATVLAGTPLYFLWQRFRATQQAADSSRQQG